ncbi:LPS translocon maturation chaperone LptM [Oxalicibacterium solurbis]|nr:lipoprotein [Oxalicibacterium solurbis]
MKLRSGTPRFLPSLSVAMGLTLLIVLGGCGQRGPLYMPQQGKPSSASARTVGPAATAPAPDAETAPSTASPDSK